jgi:hypothetical protein
MNPLAPNSPIVLAGYKGVVELSPEREGDPQSGNRTVRRFQGPENYLLALVPSIQAAKGRWRITHQIGQPLASILEASFPDLQDGSDPDDPIQEVAQWFFDVEDLQIAIRNSPQFDAVIDAFDKDALIDYLADPKYDNYPTLVTPEAIAIADVIQAGGESYLYHRIVVRRTMSISADNTRYFMANIGRKYTTADLIAAEDIPAPIATDMPAGEWLYKGSKKEGQPNGRFTVTSEWTHAPKWADIFYPYAT